MVIATIPKKTEHMPDGLGAVMHPGRKETMRKCKKCVYRGNLGTDVICNYILVTGHMRKSNIDKCERFIAGKQRKTMCDIKKKTQKNEKKTKEQTKKQIKKPVILIDQEGNEYRMDSITAAADFLGKRKDAVCKAMKRGETIYGYKWKYSDECKK